MSYQHHGYLCYSDCLRVYPRICATIMRNGYLTECEAGWVVRSWRSRAEFPAASCYWTELSAHNLRGIIASMRANKRQFAFNLREVRAYTGGARRPQTQDVTEYARAIGYTGARRLYVSDGRLVGGPDWFEFCERLRREGGGVHNVPHPSSCACGACNAWRSSLRGGRVA